MSTLDQPLSPRMAALSWELAQGNTGALDTFWKELEDQGGTPLVERIPGDEDQYLVTFLWQETSAEADALTNVVVVGHFAGWNFARNQLHRLDATPLWYRTYRLPADTRSAYWFSRNDPLVSMAETEDPGAHMARWQSDPLSRRRFLIPRDEEDPTDRETTLSLIELPNASPQPWVAPRPHTAVGTVEQQRFSSKILDNERRIWIYTPPRGGQELERPSALLLVFDGWSYRHVIPTPTILDNLVAEALIPPLVAVLVGNVDRNRELPCYAPFADFLAWELLPWVQERYNVTSDPAQILVAGSSYGGLAAAYVGWRYPAVFGNVLSQSGAFWWAPERDPEQEWLARQFVDSPCLPLRFYLDVGRFETESVQIRHPGHLLVNRHLRNVLRAKGYPVTYAEYTGAHDYVCWQGTFADGLMALLGKGAV